MTENYESFLKYTDEFFNTQISAFGPGLFRSSADPDKLYKIYLDHIHPCVRQEYVCRTCEKFIRNFGGLVVVDADGALQSAVWNAEYANDDLRESIDEMMSYVTHQRITGVFIYHQDRLGIGETGKWIHPSLTVRQPISLGPWCPNHAEASKNEDFRLVSHDLYRIPKADFEQAVRILGSGHANRADKVYGQATWFLHLKGVVENLRPRERDNIVWKWTFSAPSGHCHLSSSVLGTLLDDIQKHVPFDVMMRRFGEKMDPMQYQRPSAPPKEGAISAAEKIVNEMGLEKAFERQIAPASEVLEHAIWTPRPEQPPKKSGIFDHLRSFGRSISGSVNIPNTVVTFTKFRRDVMLQADRMQILLKNTRSPFVFFSKAVDMSAPPILQWDRPEKRNQYSVYVYKDGNLPSDVGLAEGWVDVLGVVLNPSDWNSEGEFPHFGRSVMFLVPGTETRIGKVESALFPETLKTELHSIRATIAAHSSKSKLKGCQEPHAVGLAIASGWNPDIKVISSLGESIYNIDRWE